MIPRNINKGVGITKSPLNPFEYSGNFKITNNEEIKNEIEELKNSEDVIFTTIVINMNLAKFKYLCAIKSLWYVM